MDDDSEICSAVSKGRRGIGAELKTSYYRQAVRNMEAAAESKLGKTDDQGDLLDGVAMD